jgi:DNA-binding response OmpR family regulator
MKQVLIIDESPLFRDYLKEKLEEQDLTVTAAVSGLDGISKIRSILPDLLIVDYHLTRKTCKDVLDEKRKNPNTAKIPVIVTASNIDKNRIIELVPYNVKKVFNKPIKFDSMLNTIGEVLGIPIDYDTTPCIIEAHLNDDILFIEVAQGLNRDKIDLLRFKIVELIELYGIASPKVILLLSDLQLNFADGPNVEKLLQTVCTFSQAKNKNIKILTNSSMVREFVDGHKSFAGVEVTNNLQHAMDGLLSDKSAPDGTGDQQATIIGERILTATDSAHDRGESIHMRFDAETQRVFSTDDVKAMGRSIEIAVVDDDFTIQELVKLTFAQMDANVVIYEDGKKFIDDMNAHSFDMVFLDLMMPVMNGFEVLKILHASDIRIPVIVLSAVTQREAVVHAFQAGAKSYLIKPLKPDTIMKKAAEILRANF